MLRTTVPEAAIDEHGDLEAREEHVRLAAEVRNGVPVDPVAQPHSVENGTKGQFGCGVLLPAGQHPALRLG
jgi:hypothetical protein